MSDEASPRPWRCEFGHVNAVIAADGTIIVPHTGYEANARLIVDAVNERAQLESLWARKQIHDPTGSEWHANGKLLYTKGNDFIGEMEHSDDARFVCDAVNNAPLFDILLDDRKELMHDVDRLRDLVRQMAKLLLRHADDGDGEYSDSYQIYAEARAAIGEAAPSAPCAPAPSVVSSSPNHENP